MFKPCIQVLFPLELIVKIGLDLSNALIVTLLPRAGLMVRVLLTIMFSVKVPVGISIICPFKVNGSSIAA